MAVKRRLNMDCDESWLALRPIFAAYLGAAAFARDARRVSSREKMAERPTLDGGAASLAIAKHLKHGGKHPAEAMRPDDRKEDLRSRLGAPNWPKADLRSRITGVPGPSPTIAKPQGGRGRAGRGGYTAPTSVTAQLMETLSPPAARAAAAGAPGRGPRARAAARPRAQAQARAAAGARARPRRPRRCDGRGAARRREEFDVEQRAVGRGARGAQSGGGAR